jgi:hypothetical protein
LPFVGSFGYALVKVAHFAKAGAVARSTKTDPTVVHNRYFSGRAMQGIIILQENHY